MTKGLDIYISNTVIIIYYWTEKWGVYITPPPPKNYYSNLKSQVQCMQPDHKVVTSTNTPGMMMQLTNTTSVDNFHTATPLVCD